MKRLILLHSFGRTSLDNWYQSVGSSLTDIFKVVIPDLPNPDDGKMSEWLPALNELQPDDQTILVGHSLSGALVLRYLEQAKQPIDSFYLVAATLNDLARNDLHETGFFERDFNWEQIRANSMKRFVLASTDDPTVPYWQAEYFAKQLPAELVTFSDKGHFKDETFPELVALLRKESNE
jgi:predicted alpha/beta hydrolase family esterase